MVIAPPIEKGKTREGYLIFHQILTAMYGAVIFDKISETMPGVVKNLPDDFKHKLMFGLQYHDISKHPEHGWTDELLSHKRHPTEEEWTGVIIPHPETAAAILENTGITDEVILDIVRYHHVRYDGIGIDGFVKVLEPDFGITTSQRIPQYAGYPNGVAGRELGLGPRIAKLADAVSTMVESRPYQKRKKEIADVIREVLQEDRMGAEYCPSAVSTFCMIHPKHLEWIKDFPVEGNVLSADLENRRLIRAGEFKMEMYVPPFPT